MAGVGDGVGVGLMRPSSLPSSGPSGDGLLLETGSDYLLLESGDYLLLE